MSTSLSLCWDIVLFELVHAVMVSVSIICFVCVFELGRTWSWVEKIWEELGKGKNRMRILCLKIKYVSFILCRGKSLETSLGRHASTAQIFKHHVFH